MAIEQIDLMWISLAAGDGERVGSCEVSAGCKSSTNLLCQLVSGKLEISPWPWSF